MAKEGQYASDRYITPGVIVSLILSGALIVCGLGGAVTYLTARGIDAGPVVQLVGVLVTAVTAVGHFLLSLVGRTTSAKIERNTGQWAAATGAIVDHLDTTGVTTPPAEDTAPPLIGAGPLPPAGEPPTAFAGAAPGSFGLVAGGRHVR